jgi:polyphosphate kinase
MLRERFEARVEREIAHVAAGRPGRITLKMNSLVDREAIEALYRASSAGVEIDLIIRGACALIPGVPGQSERIRVRSIIGEFLEHSRIWRFENGGEPEWLIGSADLMERNLDRRIEALVPILDPALQAELDFILATMLADDRRSWTLGSNGTWTRVHAARDGTASVDTHQVLRGRALSAAMAGTGAPPEDRRGTSLAPWA